MLKQTTSQKQQLKAATAKLKILKGQLLAAKQASGIDDYIVVKITKNQARYERSHALGASPNGVGKFFMLVTVTAKKQDVLIPLSMASGKRTAGFMYIIEGTGEATLVTLLLAPYNSARFRQAVPPSFGFWLPPVDKLEKRTRSSSVVLTISCHFQRCATCSTISHYPASP
jgi:hypothetical protein